MTHQMKLTAGFPCHHIFDRILNDRSFNNVINTNRRALQLLRKTHNLAVSRRRISVLSNLLCEMFPDAENALDVGCGSGHLAKEMMQKLGAVDIQGVDVSIHENTAIPVSSYDGNRLPFEDQSWDVAMAIDVLHHCDDPVKTIRELCRVSRRYIVIKDHISENRLDATILRFMDWFGNRGYGTALPYNFLSSADWSRAFNSCGIHEACTKKALGLYPLPFDWVFGRGLHFVSVLEKKVMLVESSSHVQATEF